MAVAAVNLMTDTIRVYDVRTLRLRLQPRHFRMLFTTQSSRLYPRSRVLHQPAATADVAMRVICYLVP